jgi:predicted transcriptional regulator
MLKCLLVKTPEDKEFFTSVENLELLTEYKNTFKATVTIIEKEDNPTLLSLEELADHLCTEDKLEKVESVIKKIPNSNKNCKDYIKRKLLNGDEVNVNEVANHLGITKTSVSSNMAKVKQEIKLTTNKNVVKVSVGVYKIDNSVVKYKFNEDVNNEDPNNEDLEDYDY